MAYTTILYLSLTILSSVLRWTSAQLKASIRSPGNPFIVTLYIQNPNQETVSVLAWNNAFDNSTDLPVLFSVKDDEGNDVQLASTRAMRGEISGNDFIQMVSGQSYSRTIDLRQVMQSVPSGPSKPFGASQEKKVFTMYPPASFKGFIGDVAAAKTIAMPATPIADLMASLQDIIVRGEAMRDSAVFPMIASENLDPTFTSNPDGVRLEKGCAAKDPLFDAGVYAHSLGLAANDSASSLFPLFFPKVSRQTVSAVATAAAQSIKGVGPHVDIYCTDIQDRCNNSNILGYSFTPSYMGNAYIVLCPSTIALGRAPPSCDKPGGKYSPSMSTSNVLFHLLMTLNNVVTTVMVESVYGVVACKHLANSTLVDPTKNPDSFAQLAMAHWASGSGGTPYSCLPPTDQMPNKARRAATTPQTHETPKNRNTRSISRPSPRREEKRNMLAELNERTQDCSAAELDLVDIAITNARALAYYASDDLHNEASKTSADRWTTFFDGNDTIKSQVKGVYEALHRWNTTSPYASDIHIRCDPPRRSRFCKISAPIQVIPQYPHFILVICPEFFYFPVSLECINPSRIPFESLAEDMGGLMLHELTHVDTASKSVKQIGDGDPECYTWSCMTRNAREREGPGVGSGGENLPERVASHYEYFAYSARATRVHCRWSEYAGHAYGAVKATHQVAGSQILGGSFGI